MPLFICLFTLLLHTVSCLQVFESEIDTLPTCVCRQLMFLAYLFFLVWLGVTAFTSLPVFMYFNVWSMCQNTSVVEGANFCLDLRQFGMWSQLICSSNFWSNMYRIMCAIYTR